MVTRQSGERHRAGRRPATLAAAGHWTVEGLRIPVAGQWIVRVDLLISDFEKIVLEDEIRLPRLP
jgi:copper transport protein